MGHGFLREAGFQHQVLGLVAGDEHLGQGQQVGAGLACLAHASRAMAALPGKSPTVGFNCPRVMRNVSVMAFPYRILPPLIGEGAAKEKSGFAPAHPLG